MYNKAISLNKIHKNQLENCKFLLNRSSCFISLLQYSQAIAELSKILNILSRQKNIAIINKEDQITLDNISNLEFLCFVRRAAAYNFDKNYHASASDYKNALEIKNEPSILENYKKVKELINY